MSSSPACLRDGLGPGACYRAGLIAFVVGTKVPTADWALQQGNPGQVPDRPAGVAPLPGTEMGHEWGRRWSRGTGRGCTREQTQGQAARQGVTEGSGGGAGDGAGGCRWYKGWGREWGRRHEMGQQVWQWGGA